MTDDEIDSNTLAIATMYQAVFEYEIPIFKHLLNRVEAEGSMILEFKRDKEKSWKPMREYITARAIFKKGHTSGQYQFAVTVVPFEGTIHTIPVNRKIRRKFDDLLKLFSI